MGVGGGVTQVGGLVLPDPTPRPGAVIHAGVGDRTQGDRRAEQERLDSRGACRARADCEGSHISCFLLGEGTRRLGW